MPLTRSRSSTWPNRPNSLRDVHGFERRGPRLIRHGPPTSRGGIELALIFGAVVLRLTPETSALSFLVLAGYAFFGRRQAVHALALAWLFSVLNPVLAAEVSAGSTVRYIVVFASALSIAVRARNGGESTAMRQPVLATFLLCSFLLVHSLLFSVQPAISILKSISWSIVALTAMAAWCALQARERARLERQMFGGLVFVCIASLVVLPTSMGYLRNGTGFQGVLSHPQAFGATMAILSAWAVCSSLSRAAPSWPLISVGGVSVGLVIMSEARTAGLALAFGVLLAVLFGALPGKVNYPSLAGLRHRRVHALALVLLGLVIIRGPDLAGYLSGFLEKRSDTSNLLDVYDASRGSLVRDMWSNIRREPVSGIGFGVASDLSQTGVVRDSLLGLPLTASVEKGVAPVAVLEEIGIPGFACVFLWAVAVLRRSKLAGGVPAMGVALTIFLVNLGESSLFSAGGLGTLMLLFLGWAATGEVATPAVASRSVDARRRSKIAAGPASELSQQAQQTHGAVP